MIYKIEGYGAQAPDGRIFQADSASKGFEIWNATVKLFGHAAVYRDGELIDPDDLWADAQEEAIKAGHQRRSADVHVDLELDVYALRFDISVLDIRGEITKFVFYPQNADESAPLTDFLEQLEREKAVLSVDAIRISQSHDRIRPYLHDMDMSSTNAASVPLEIIPVEVELEA